MLGKQIHSTPRSEDVSFNDLISTIFFVISVNSFLNIPKDVSVKDEVKSSFLGLKNGNLLNKLRTTPEVNTKVAF